MADAVIPVDWNGKEDNNNKYIYGIEHQDENKNVIDIKWFKTEKERNKVLNNFSKKKLDFKNERNKRVNAS